MKIINAKLIDVDFNKLITVFNYDSKSLEFAIAALIKLTV